MSEPLLVSRGLSLSYPASGGRAFALDGVDLTLAAGERLALVGESGSGKTPFGLATGRLLPPQARREAGELQVAGVSVFAADDAAIRELRRRRLGYVFQNPMTALDPTLRIGRQVAYAAGGASPAAVEDLLAKADLEDPARVARSFPHELSGGMAQRVVIAMAIARRPALLVADEPTASLDASIRARVMTTLVELQRTMGAGLLLLSHDLRLVARHAERVAVMYGGRIVELGATDDVMTRPAHPYTRALLRAAAGQERPGERLSPIPGVPPVLRGPSTGCAFAPRCAYRQASCVAQRPAADEFAGRIVVCPYADRLDRLASAGEGAE